MDRHEIPTHLETPDRFALGLEAKQAMQLVAAASSAYGLLDLHWLPLEVRVLGAALACVAGALLALLRPGGRALEQTGYQGRRAGLMPLHQVRPACRSRRPALQEIR